MRLWDTRPERSSSSDLTRCLQVQTSRKVADLHNRKGDREKVHIVHVFNTAPPRTRFSISRQK